MTPIIFIHRGYNLYMEYTLRQCRYANPEADIFLLGDERNDRFSFLYHYSLSGLQNNYKNFDEAYSHLSSHSCDYELFCFHRWFIIRDFMQKQKIEKVFVCDTDLMLYKNVETCQHWTNKKEAYAAFCISNQSESSMHWCASAHSSWWTIEGISEFCRFLEYMYQYKLDTLLLKWKYHLSNNLPGGICDMTLLYLFHKRYQNRIVNLLTIVNNEVFDNNINEGHNLTLHEYETNERGMKKVSFVKERPTIFNKVTKQYTQLNSLHFQGPGKNKIHAYYQGKAAGLLFLKRVNDKASREYNHYVGEITKTFLSL